MQQPQTVPAQRVALPAHLPPRLQAFRIGKGDRQTYVVRDKLKNKTYDFEPWQFFVLEVLPGCTDEPKLSSIFEDRFGRALPRPELRQLFADLADAELLNEAAAAHPLLKPFCKKTYVEQDGQPVLKSFRDVIADPPPQSRTTPVPPTPRTADQPRSAHPSPQHPVPSTPASRHPAPYQTATAYPHHPGAGHPMPNYPVPDYPAPSRAPLGTTMRLATSAAWSPAHPVTLPLGTWPLPGAGGRPANEGNVVPITAALRATDESKGSTAPHVVSPAPAKAEPIAPEPAPATPASPTPAKPAGEKKPADEKKPSPAAAKGVDENKVLPAGIQDALGLDPRAGKVWVLFNPRWLLRLVAPLVAPLKYGVYGLPLLACAALYLSVRYTTLIQEDLTRLIGHMNWIQHAVYSLVSVSAAVTATTAIVAFRYRATVDGIGLALLLRFIPRLTARLSHLEQLSRGERMWLHAAPLLTRLALWSTGTIVWFITRPTNTVLATGGLGLALMAQTGLILTANPLVKSSGYYLLAAFLNEPHLRGKAQKVLWGRIRGRTFKEGDSLLPAVYALATLTFAFLLVVTAALVAGVGLYQIELGGSAIVAAAALGLVLVWRLYLYFGRVQAAYERSVQFERWRQRVVPEQANDVAPEKKSGIAGYLRVALPLSLLALAFLPYQYTPGGKFTVFPGLQQVVATDVSGVIKEVYYDGGETLAKGTVIARLADDDLRAQVAIYAAKMNEQQAIIDDLKARPRPEEVALARQALQVEQTRSTFAKTEAQRSGRLYGKGAVSLEEYENAHREYQVSLGRVSEKYAALQLAQLGASEGEIASAQAKWESLKAEHDAQVDKVKRSVLVMPFDGRLMTLHLKQKGNAYYKAGDPFAAVEHAGSVTAEIEVPECEREYVSQAATVRARPTAFSTELFLGQVSTLDANVTVQPTGNVVKVIATMENPDRRLANGMTGYAKIYGPTMPSWKAFSVSLRRFLSVEVWSWIP